MFAPSFAGNLLCRTRGPDHNWIPHYGILSGLAMSTRMDSKKQNEKTGTSTFQFNPSQSRSVVWMGLFICRCPTFARLKEERCIYVCCTRSPILPLSPSAMQAGLVAGLVVTWAGRAAGHGAVVFPPPRQAVDSELQPWSGPVPHPLPGVDAWCPVRPRLSCCLHCTLLCCRCPGRRVN